MHMFFAPCAWAEWASRSGASPAKKRRTLCCRSFKQCADVLICQWYMQGAEAVSRIKVLVLSKITRLAESIDTLAPWHIFPAPVVSFFLPGTAIFASIAFFALSLLINHQTISFK